MWSLAVGATEALAPLLDRLFLHFGRQDDWHHQVWLCSRFEAEPQIYPDPDANAVIRCTASLGRAGSLGQRQAKGINHRCSINYARRQVVALGHDLGFRFG